MRSSLRACFENILGGLAAGRTAGFVAHRLQISCEYAPSSRLARRPPRAQSHRNLFSKQAPSDWILAAAL